MNRPLVGVAYIALLAVSTVVVGFAVIDLLRTLAPTMPDDLRGFIAACLVMPVGFVIIIQRVTA